VIVFAKAMTVKTTADFKEVNAFAMQACVTEFFNGLLNLSPQGLSQVVDSSSKLGSYIRSTPEHAKANFFFVVSVLVYVERIGAAFESKVSIIYRVGDAKQPLY
jgi:hypothetical protein